MMTVFKDLAEEIQERVLSKIEKHTPSNISLEEYVSLLTTETLKEMILSGELNDEIRNTVINKFKQYVQGTEYNTSAIIEHFEFFVTNEIQSIQLNFIVSPSRIKVFVRTPVDIFGAMSTWEGAILSVRKVLSKFPNKYPIRASYYWRREVYPSSKLDETMALRLSYAYGQASYVRFIEQGTNVKLSSSYGGFPTPSYAGKGSFIPLMDREIEDILNTFISRELPQLQQQVISHLRRDLGEFPLTSKLRDILAHIAQSDVEKIIAEIKTATDTTRVLSVIINIEDKYYRIVRTRKGNWGLRFDISRYNRRR